MVLWQCDQRARRVEDARKNPPKPSCVDSHRLGLAPGGLLSPLAALRPVNCPDERRFWREGLHGPVGQQEDR